MEYNQAIKKLKDNNFILAVGNEDFYRDQVRNKISSLYPELELEILDADDLGEKDILSKINYKDLFHSSKIFCIKNFLNIKDLKFFIQNSVDHKIILDSKNKGRSNDYKVLEKYCLYIDCDKPKPWLQEEDGLNKIKSYLNKSGIDVSIEVSKYFYENIGYNLYKIMRECQKLLIYKQETNSKEVIKEDIDSICLNNLNYNIFNLIDLVIDNKKYEAINLLDTILSNDPNATILLINLWYTHFENLLYMKDCNNKNFSTYLKMPISVIEKKIKPQSEKLKLDKILSSLSFISNVDSISKKGSFNTKLYLEKFIIDF